MKASLLQNAPEGNNNEEVNDSDENDLGSSGKSKCK
jgi:hypothetical protein